MKRWWGIDTAVFFAIFVALMAAGAGPMLRDPGTFWHQRAGEVILDSGHVITTDSFSWLFHGKPWLAHAWVAEVAQVLLWRIGGWDALLLAAAASLAGFFAWMARRLSASGLQSPVVALVVVMTVATCSSQFLVRPLLLSILAMGWIVARLSDVEEERLPASRLLAILPLLVLWTNVHGAVLGGLVTIAMALAGWTAVAIVRPQLERWPGLRAQWPTPVRDGRGFALLLAFGVLAALTVFVNPYGAGLPRQWLAVVSSPVIPRLIVEHAPARLSDPSSLALFALGALYVGALAGVPWRRLRVTWLLPLAWLVMACSRIRHAPLFAASAAVALAAMVPHVRWFGWLVEHGSELLRLGPREEPPATRALLPALAVAACLALQAAKAPVPVFGSGWVQLDPDYWPMATIPDLEAYAREKGPGAPVFNEMLYGGFLIEFAPQLRVFIDDRCELYGDGHLGRYEAALLGDDAQIAAWTGDPAVGLALVIQGSPFDRFLRASPQWRIVRETPSATLLRRNDAGAASSATRLHGDGGAAREPA